MTTSTIKVRKKRNMLKKIIHVDLLFSVCGIGVLSMRQVHSPRSQIIVALLSHSVTIQSSGPIQTSLEAIAIYKRGKKKNYYLLFYHIEMYNNKN